MNNFLFQPKLTQSILIVLTIILVSISGCSSNKEKETETLAAEEMYNTARLSLKIGNYKKAEIYYKRLMARFPYGTHAQNAQLELAYAHFKNYEPELATAAADKFIRTYPTHEYLPYAFYLKGVVNFNKDRGLVHRLFKQDTADRDQFSSKESFLSFKEVAERFPDTVYAKDAKQRMVYLRNLLAEHDLAIANYYLSREAYVGAANRAKDIIELYPQAPANADALVILIKSYNAMGLEDLAKDSEQVLALNYPNHSYITKQKKSKGFTDYLWPF